MVLPSRLQKTTHLTTLVTMSTSSIFWALFPPIFEPITFSYANRYKACHSAMKDEIQALRSNDTWSLIPFTQQECINYSKTFSPVIKQMIVRLVFSIAVSRGWMIHQLNIHNVFLNLVLVEEVYMQKPSGFVDFTLSSYVCRLYKSLYA